MQLNSDMPIQAALLTCGLMTVMAPPASADLYYQHLDYNPLTDRTELSEREVIAYQKGYMDGFCLDQGRIRPECGESYVLTPELGRNYVHQSVAQVYHRANFASGVESRSYDPGSDSVALAYAVGLEDRRCISSHQSWLNNPSMSVGTCAYWSVAIRLLATVAGPETMEDARQHNLIVEDMYR